MDSGSTDHVSCIYWTSHRASRPRHILVKMRLISRNTLSTAIIVLSSVHVVEIDQFAA